MVAMVCVRNGTTGTKRLGTVELTGGDRDTVSTKVLVGEGDVLINMWINSEGGGGWREIGVL